MTTSRKGGVVFRQLVIAPILLLLFAPIASAQQWAYKMFEETAHDFGTVARSSESEHVFEMQNIFKEPIHVSGVRASCGCAIPSIVKQDLKTWEKGGILVKFNTRAFLGQRKATITVTIDRPYYAEVQLTITGFIRGDVVFDPGTVDFGSVDQGSATTKLVTVNYAGRQDWRIKDILSANTNLVVEPVETQRNAGRVGYQLKVHLKEEAPAGFFNDQMILVTNDYQQQQIPLLVQGTVVSPLTVSPSALSLGVVKPGQTVVKKIVVRGNQPFRITRVGCPDGCFQFEPTDDAKKMHLIPVRFTASDESGQVSQEIEIETDIGPGAVRTLLATATIRENDDAN